MLLSTVPKQAPKAVDRGLLIERVGADLLVIVRNTPVVSAPLQQVLSPACQRLTFTAHADKVTGEFVGLVAGPFCGQLSWAVVWVTGRKGVAIASSAPSRPATMATSARGSVVARAMKGLGSHSLAAHGARWSLPVRRGLTGHRGSRPCVEQTPASGDDDRLIGSQ